MDQSFGTEGGYLVTDEALQNAANFPGRSTENPTQVGTGPHPTTPDFDALPEESV